MSANNVVLIEEFVNKLDMRSEWKSKVVKTLVSFELSIKNIKELTKDDMYDLELRDDIANAFWNALQLKCGKTQELQHFDNGSGDGTNTETFKFNQALGNETGNELVGDDDENMDGVSRNEYVTITNLAENLNPGVDNNNGNKFNTSFDSLTDDDHDHGNENDEKEESGNVCESTKDIKGKVIGFRNLGNTCYMNTALQCLLHTPPLMRVFMNEIKLLKAATKEKEEKKSNDWRRELKEGSDVDYHCKYSNNETEWIPANVEKINVITNSKGKEKVTLTIRSKYYPFANHKILENDIDLQSQKIAKADTKCGKKGKISHWRGSLTVGSKVLFIYETRSRFNFQQTKHEAKGTIFEEHDDDWKFKICYKDDYGIQQISKWIDNSDPKLQNPENINLYGDNYGKNDENNDEIRWLDSIPGIPEIKSFYKWGMSSSEYDNDKYNKSQSHSWTPNRYANSMYKSVLDLIDQVHIDSSKNGRYLVPDKIHRMLGREDSAFKRKEQHDCGQALSLILTGVQESMPDKFIYNPKLAKQTQARNMHSCVMKHNYFDKKKYGDWDKNSDDLGLIQMLIKKDMLSADEDLITKTFNLVETIIKTCLNCGFEERTYVASSQFAMPVEEKYFVLQMFYYLNGTMNSLKLKLQCNATILLAKFAALFEIFHKKNMADEVSNYTIVKLNSKMINIGFICPNQEKVMDCFGKSDNSIAFLVPKTNLKLNNTNSHSNVNYNNNFNTSRRRSSASQSSIKRKVLCFIPTTNTRENAFRMELWCFSAEVGECQFLSYCQSYKQKEKEIKKEKKKEKERKQKRKQKDDTSDHKNNDYNTNEYKSFDFYLNGIKMNHDYDTNKYVCSSHVNNTMLNSFHNSEKDLNFLVCVPPSTSNDNDIKNNDNDNNESVITAIKTIKPAVSLVKLNEIDIETYLKKLIAAYKTENQLSGNIDIGAGSVKHNASIVAYKILISAYKAYFQSLKQDKQESNTIVNNVIREALQLSKEKHKRINVSGCYECEFTDLDDCLRSYGEQIIEIGSTSNFFRKSCKCDLKFIATKRKVALAPEILIIKLDRTDSQSHKQQRTIQFNGKKKMFGNWYDLYAVAKHSGSTGRFGHYFAHVKQLGTNQWWNCNDSSCHKISTFSAHDAIQMMYHKRE